MARYALFVRTGMYFDRFGKVAVRWRSGCLPLERGRIPWIVRWNLAPFPNADEEIDDERKLCQAQQPGGMGDADVGLEHRRSKTDCGVGLSVSSSAVGHTAVQSSHAL